MTALNLLVLCSLLVGINSLPLNTTGLGGVFGIDVSSSISVDTFNCLKNSGFDFVIVRAYQSICKYAYVHIMYFTICVGSPDHNAPGTIRNARSAGIKYVDVYMFPSPRCSRSATEQVNDMGKEEGERTQE